MLVGVSLTYGPGTVSRVDYFENVDGDMQLRGETGGIWSEYYDGLNDGIDMTTDDQYFFFSYHNEWTGPSSKLFSYLGDMGDWWHYENSLPEELKTPSVVHHFATLPSGPTLAVIKENPVIPYAATLYYYDFTAPGTMTQTYSRVLPDGTDIVSMRFNPDGLRIAVLYGQTGKIRIWAYPSYSP
jgi:hypothetical protein